MSKNKSKLTLLVDGNWLLMSRLAVLSNKFTDDEELCHNVKKMMVRSMNIVLKQFPLIDNIIFVADGGSWRNKLAIPACLQKDGVEYKGTRVRSEDFNWDMLFASYNEFTTALNTAGITACHESGIEGDDWCYHWSKVLNAQGTNCIIWTKDKDLTQLVKTDKNNCFTVWWNKDSGIICEDIDDNELDFLFNVEYNANEYIYNDLIKRVKNVTKINPMDVVIDKIIKGDGSDNIQPIILRKSKSNSTKKYRVSQKDIDFSLNINNENDVKTYIDELIHSKNYEGRVDKSFDDIIEHFNYNKRLVWLNESSYPESILYIFNKYNTCNVSKDISPVEEQINAETNKLTGILDMI